jgi:hypothetical protein
LAALFIGKPMSRDDMRRYWMIANYLVAITLAMIGCLWLIAWIAAEAKRKGHQKRRLGQYLMATAD